MSDIEKVFPGETWDFVQPEDVGLNAEKMTLAQLDHDKVG